MKRFYLTIAAALLLSPMLAAAHGICIIGPSGNDEDPYCSSVSDPNVCRVDTSHGCEWREAYLICVPGPSLPDAASVICRPLSEAACAANKQGCVLQETYGL